MFQDLSDTKPLDNEKPGQFQVVVEAKKKKLKKPAKSNHDLFLSLHQNKVNIKKHKASKYLWFEETHIANVCAASRSSGQLLLLLYGSPSFVSERQ